MRRRVVVGPHRLVERVGFLEPLPVGAGQPGAAAAGARPAPEAPPLRPLDPLSFPLVGSSAEEVEVLAGEQQVPGISLDEAGDALAGNPGVASFQ